MGSWFSTGKSDVVDTAIIRVIEDEYIPDSRVSALVKSLAHTSSDFSIIDFVTDEVVNSPWRGYEEAYRWVEETYGKEGGAYYSLPTVKVRDNHEGFEPFKKILLAHYLPAKDAEVLTIRYRPINHFHEAWRFLHSDWWKWSPVWNISRTLSIEKNTYVFLKSVVGTYNIDPKNMPESSALDNMFPSKEQPFSSVNGLPLPTDGVIFNDIQEWKEESKRVTGDLDENGEAVIVVTPGKWVPKKLSLLERNMAARLLDVSGRAGPDEINSVEFLWQWRDSDNILQEWIQVVPVALSQDVEVYQAKVKYKNIPTLQDPRDFYYDWWTYDPAEGLYPSIDELFNIKYVNPGTYFPWLVFRREKKSRTSEAAQKDSPAEYASNVKLAKKMNFDFQSLGDQISESPDIENVDQAMMALVAPLNTEDPSVITYLHDYFTDLIERLPEAATNRFNDISLFENTTTFQDPEFIQDLSDSATDQSFALEFTDGDIRMVFSFDAITTQRQAGVIGETDENGYGIPGSVNSTIVYTEGTLEADPVLFPVMMWDVLELNYLKQSQHIFQKQITSAIYQEIRVFNATLRYDTGYQEVVWSGGSNPTLLIPLDYNICRKLTPFQREVLYNKTSHFIFNAHQIQKTKWYEKDAFKTVLKIAALALLVYSAGQSIEAAAAAFAAIEALGPAIWAAISVILKDIVIAAAVSWVALKVVEIVGIKNAFILAAVVAITAYYSGDTTAVENTFIEFATSAETLLMASTGLLAGIETHSYDLLTDVMKDAELFELYAEQKWEELEEKSERFKPNEFVDPWAVSRLIPLYVENESPGDFYDRTIHSGNIGTRAFEIIENFVDESLRLP